MSRRSLSALTSERADSGPVAHRAAPQDLRAAPSAAEHSFEWPPPPEDLDDVALIQFPSESPRRVAATPERAPDQVPRKAAQAPPPTPVTDPAAPDPARFLLEDFPRARARPGPAPAGSPDRSDRARWVVAFVALLGFVALIGSPSISVVAGPGSLPEPKPAPRPLRTAEPYRPPPVELAELVLPDR